MARTSVRFMLDDQARAGTRRPPRTAASAGLPGATSTVIPVRPAARAASARSAPSARPTPCCRCGGSTKMRRVQPPGSPSRQNA